MAPALLTILTEDSRYQLSCPADARFMLGSAEECEIALDGADIRARHAQMIRVADRRFSLTALSREAPLTVNGVMAAHLEVDVPFRLALGGAVIDFDLQDDSAPAERETTATPRRRDYLMGPIVLRKRTSRPSMFSAPPSAPLPESRLIPISGPAPPSADIAPPAPHARRGRRVWPWLALLMLTGLVVISRDHILPVLARWIQPKVLKRETVTPDPVPPPPSVVSKPSAATSAPPSPPPAVADVAEIAAREAAAHVRAYLQSWSEPDASGVFAFLSATPASYFGVASPSPDAILRMEEDWRAHWPRRQIDPVDDAVTTSKNAAHVEVLHRYQFELQGQNRTARGTGELRCTVERDADARWRLTSTADRVELRQAIPSRPAFTSATALRGLIPVLSEEERKQAHVRQVQAWIKAGDYKPALTAAVQADAHDAFWHSATDTLCDALSRALFADGRWADPTCLDEVKQLSARGIPSALLLHGHLLRAGYLLPRSEVQGEMLYRQAYETSKSREARFYYAEALFMGGEVEKAASIALAVMISSKHPLEAYLAAHLLWKKAELDPSLWQKVYETVARVATQHPPARNLAGLVLLQHGQTRKEREAGFALIRQAAEAGVVEAMKNLAACYETGNGCEPDPAVAQHWKSKAAATPAPKRRHFSEWALE